MKIRIELTDGEMKEAIELYISKKVIGGTDLKIVEFYPALGTIVLSNEKEKKDEDLQVNK